MNFSAFANSRGGEFHPDPDRYTSCHAKKFCEALISVREDFLQFTESLNRNSVSSGCTGVNLQIGYLIGRSENKNRLLNAASLCENGHDFIGIYLNLAASTWKFYSKIVDSGLVDSLNSTIYTDLINYNEDSIHVELNDSNLGMSNLNHDFSELEFNFVASFFSESLTWIMGHELAHIWFGHCNYLELIENDEKSLPKLTESENFSIEINSDDRATVGLFLDKFPTKIHENKTIFDISKINPNEFSFKILRSIIAIKVCFILIGMKYEVGNDHPNYSLRKTRSINYFRIFFSGNEHSMLMFDHANEFSDGILSTLIYKSYGNEFLESINLVSKEEIYDYNHIDKNWKETCLKLSPYMRGEKITRGFEFGRKVGSLNAAGKVVPD